MADDSTRDINAIIDDSLKRMVSDGLIWFNDTVPDIEFVLGNLVSRIIAARMSSIRNVYSFVHSVSGLTKENPKDLFRKMTRSLAELHGPWEHTFIFNDMSLVAINGKSFIAFWMRYSSSQKYNHIDLFLMIIENTSQHEVASKTKKYLESISSEFFVEGPPPPTFRMPIILPDGSMGITSDLDIVDEDIYTWDPKYMDLAYPYIAEVSGGIENFLNEFLDSTEPMIVVAGPRGSGKTMFWARWLGFLTRVYEDTARGLLIPSFVGNYAMEFYKLFITPILQGEDSDEAPDTIMIEEAHRIISNESDILTPLILAVTGLGAMINIPKIFLVANTAALGGLEEEALKRAGRTFAVVRTRPLRPNEALELAGYLADKFGYDATRVDIVENKSKKDGSISLGDVWKLMKHGKMYKREVKRIGF